MGKPRKLKLQEFDYDRDKLQESITSPIRPHFDRLGTSLYKAGEVVTIANLELSGTIIDLIGKNLAVLDQTHIIHHVKDFQVYKSQS